MIIREIDKEKDLPEIARWFENRKWPMPVVQDIGPGFGIMAEEDGVGYACVWAYLTGRSIAFLDWCGTNPSVGDREGVTALDECFMHLKRMCEMSEPKIRALSMVTKNRFIANHLEARMGFRKEEDCFRLLWTAKPSKSDK